MHKSKKSLKTLESEVRNKARRGAIEMAVLKSLYGAGLITVAVMAPNIVRLLKHVDPQWIVPLNPRQRVHETLYRMKRKGLVTFIKKGGKQVPVLTQKGKQMAGRLHVGEVKIRTPLRWDGRWRIVTFDIPERKRQTRDAVRYLVKRLGFMRLQNSVWAHPYDCEELIALIKSDLKIGKDVLYVIADAVEYDRPLREFFKLPLK